LCCLYPTSTVFHCIPPQDANGVNHQTRAFNTKIAEQLNSWLNGFESQLCHMSDIDYDLFVHVLTMIYAEKVEKQVFQKNLGLSDEFWIEAVGINRGN
jgi:glutamine synthetase type III